MITYSIVQKSQLEGARRLDAEYYQPEYLAWQNQISNLKPVKLNEVTSKVDVGFVSSMVSHFQESGIPLLRTQNVREFFVDRENDIVYIDEEFNKKLKKSQVQPGYLLLARSGSIGNVGIVPQDFPRANSADIILIKISNDQTTPEYLATFLNSRYGRFQIERGSSGGLQGHINLFSLEQLKVPLADRVFQEKITSLVRNGLSSINESKSLYQQAENLLLEELGLRDLELGDDLSFIVDFSEVEKAERIDAEYFQPKFQNLENKLKEYRAKAFNEIIENISPRFVPNKDEEYKYVELANVNSSLGIIDGKSCLLGKDLPSRAKRVLKTGDVLISSIEGSLEKTALVSEENNGYIASTGFFQLRSKELLPEVILVVAKSIVFQMQLQKRTTGTILSAVPKESLDRILVPVLSRDFQQKISELVKRSHEARKKSKELLEKAKRKVEEFIENGAEE